MNKKDKIVKCKICGRKLKDPISIKRQMGNSCYKKHLKEKRRRLI